MADAGELRVNAWLVTINDTESLARWFFTMIKTLFDNDDDVSQW